MKLSQIGRQRLVLLLILIIGAALRLFGLADAPPGLTHDEAVHGLSAWNVVTGVERPIYFAVANGREPLFDYLTALVMVFTGPSWLAPRLVSIFFGMALIGATYLLIQKLFSSRVALLTVAMLSFGFWPVMVSRHALRTSLMPVFLVLGVYFWVKNSEGAGERSGGFLHSIPAWAWSGILLGVGFYTYIPARIMWLLLPAALLWWLIFDRDKFNRMWQSTVATLGTMLLVASPLLTFLALNREAESRIRDLAGPLAQARSGDWSALGRNMAEGIRFIVTIGDGAWRYNIPNRPILLPIFAAFFGFGLILIWWFKRDDADGEILQKPAGFIMLWLLLGMVPIFVTGSFLGTTQAIAIMPVVYIFPAVFIDALWRWSAEDMEVLGVAMTVFLLGYLALDTIQTYFVDWATHPQVRLQYETALIDGLANLDPDLRGPVAISVDEPGRYHDAAVGLLANNSPDAELKFFDGRYSLLIPAGDNFTLLDTRLAPLFMLPPPQPIQAENADNAAVADIDELLNTVELNANELRTDFVEFLAQSQDDVLFGNAIRLESFQPRPDPQNQQFGIMTVWTVVTVPAHDLVQFTHLFGRDGEIVAQMDKLSVPTSSWQVGDTIVQLHTIDIPADIIADANPITGQEIALSRLVLGWYDPATGERLPMNINGVPEGDSLELNQ